MTMINPKPLTPYLDLPLRESNTRSWPRLPGAEIIPIRRDGSFAADTDVQAAAPGTAIGAGDDGCAASWAY